MNCFYQWNWLFATTIASWSGHRAQQPGTGRLQTCNRLLPTAQTAAVGRWFQPSNGPLPRPPGLTVLVMLTASGEPVRRDKRGGRTEGWQRRCVGADQPNQKHGQSSMGPVIFSVAAKMAKDKRRRVCPWCQKEQIVPQTKVAEPVQCQSCGKQIPPKK